MDKVFSPLKGLRSGLIKRTSAVVPGTPPELTAFSFDTSTQPDTLDGITVSGTWTRIRWQVDGTTSYASPAAMDAAQGAANGFGSFTSLPATIDLTGLADGPYNLHMYAENGSGKQTGAPVSQAITVDNTAATLSSVTGTPSGLNITWGVTSNSAQGTIYAAARLAANPVLTTSEIRNGTGNALATSSDATPAADASNGGTLALGSGGTYRVDVYQDDGFGNISSVVSSSDVVLASYTQNIVDNNGVGRFQWDIGNQPTNGTLNKLTASVWLVNQSIGVTTNVIGGNLTFNLRKNSTEQITVQVWDSAGTTIYNQTSTGLTLSTTSGVLDHIQVTVDLSVPSIAIYFNGSDVTVSAFGSSSISAGTGFLKTGTNNIFFPGNDFQYADFFISYGDALSNSALYNGGTPPNPGTIAGGPLIGSPQILLGGDMVASDWDAGTNIGSGTFTVNATGFTDVP